MKKRPLTYKQAGVDIRQADKLLGKIRHLVASTYNREVLRGIGGFGALFKLNKKYKNPILVSSSDGVGTKLKIASLLNKHDTVGIDLVAMNVNDILCCGAKPLFFLDYLGCSKLHPGVFRDIIKGVIQGCREADCALIGGETAEMPGMYKTGEYDLAGFSLGVVERDDLIDGSKIKLADSIIGLASNGLHSNGFSLVRKVFSRQEIKLYARQLLKPTRIYVKPVLSILQDKRYNIKAIAHITGGAFYSKIKRIIPDNLNIQIRKGSWSIPKIFRLIQLKGNIKEKEMFSTFNMGIGMILVVSRTEQEKILNKLSSLNLRSWVIGQITKGNKEVVVR